MNEQVTSEPRYRVVLRAALLILALAAVTLGVLVTQQSSRNSQVVAANGAVIQLSNPVYARATTVLVPDNEITIGVGLPTRRLEWADVTGGYDLEDGDPPEFIAAPNDGRWVPISWRLLPYSGPDIFYSGPEIDRKGPPVALHLVSGDQRIPLWTPKRRDYLMTDSTNAAVAMPGTDGLDGLVIEVEYDGVVQRIDAATGELDTGAAQGLYDSRTFDTSCTAVPADCSFSAAAADQPLLPSDTSFSASPLHTYAYDGELGWAADGSVWASTGAQMYGGHAYDSAGTSTYVPADQVTQVQLLERDGTVIEPTLNELAEPATASYGRVVFAVPTDVEPKALVLRQRARLEDDPRRVPLVARVPLS